MGAYHEKLWGDAVFAAVNAVLASYAIVAFVGIRHSLVDIWTNIVSYLYRPQRFEPAPPRRPAPQPVATNGHLPDWELVLYLGFGERRRQQRAVGPQPAQRDTAPTPQLQNGAQNGSAIADAAQPGFFRVPEEWSRPEP